MTLNRRTEKPIDIRKWSKLQVKYGMVRSGYGLSSCCQSPMIPAEIHDDTFKLECMNCGGNNAWCGMGRVDFALLAAQVEALLQEVPVLPKQGSLLREVVMRLRSITTRRVS